MTSKLIQNEPYGRQKTLPTPSRKRAENKHEKRISKTLKNKPVLASEREARSRLEPCGKNVSQLLDWQDKQTDATEMIILCLHVLAAPVVFGRAWRRDLDHVYRVSINTLKTIKKQCIQKKYIQSAVKNITWSQYNLEQRHYILYEISFKKLFKIRLKHTPKWPEMAPFWGLGATLEPWCHQSH